MPSYFSCSVKDFNVWKAVFDAVSEVLDECVFFVREGGIRVASFDQARICYLMLDLNKNIFNSIDIEGDEVVFKVGVDNITKVHRRLSKGDASLVISHDSDDNFLSIVSIGKRPSRTKREFKINLFEMREGEDRYDPIDRDFQMTVAAHFDLDVGVFKDAVKDMELYGSHTAIDVDGDKKSVMFKARGEMGEATFTIPSVDGSAVEVFQSSSSKFSLHFMHKITKSVPMSSGAELEVGQDAPLRFTFTLKDKSGMEEYGKLIYYLAPIVSEDEDDGIDASLLSDDIDLGLDFDLDDFDDDGVLE